MTAPETDRRHRRAAHYDVSRHTPGTRQVELHARSQYIAFCVSRGRLFFPANAQTIYEFLRERSHQHSNDALRATKHGLRAFFLRMDGDDALQDVALHFTGNEDPLRLAVRLPLTLARLSDFLTRLDNPEPLDLRDRAVLGLAIVGLASQESLRALRIRDVVFTAEGALLFTVHPVPRVVRLRAVGGPVCLVRALRKWLAVRSGAPDDYVFVTRHRRGGFRAVPLTRYHIDCLIHKVGLMSGYDPRRYGTGKLRAYFTFDTLV